MHSTLSLEVAPLAAPSIRRERGVAQLLGAFAVLALSATATSTGVVPFAAHLVLATAALVTLMVVAHDAIHSAAHADGVLNRAIGWLASFACAVPFVMLASNHLRHHRLVDTREDPERFCLGPAWQLPVRWPAMLGFYWVETWPRLGGVARAKSVAFGVVLLAAVVAFPALLVLWVAPLLLAATLFAGCTVWLPHGPLGDVVMRKAPWLTGFHDDHHARPAFPVHQYAALHRWHVARGVVTRQPKLSLRQRGEVGANAPGERPSLLGVTSPATLTRVTADLVTKLVAHERAFDVAPLLEAATVELVLGEAVAPLSSALGALRRGGRAVRALGRARLALDGRDALSCGLDVLLQQTLAKLSYHPQVRRAVEAELLQGSTRMLACAVRETVRLHPGPGARVPHQAWRHPQAFDPSRFADDTRSSALEQVAVEVLAVVLTKVRVDVRAGFKARAGCGLEVRVTPRSSAP